MKQPIKPVAILKYKEKQFLSLDDLVVSEEPLELRLLFDVDGLLQEKSMAVTMRTPNADYELALGFLLTEGIIRNTKEIEKVFHCPQVPPEAQGNVLKIVLKKGIVPQLVSSERHLYMSSSCGICGKASLEQVNLHCSRAIVFEERISPTVVCNLSDQLANTQLLFRHTGGLHAAAIFDAQGNLLCLKEDIGRHNAVDKVVGELYSKKINPDHKILFLSGRAGFELVQKAALAGLGMVVAVGAPSSLAVELAQRMNITLIGFSRGHSFNIYSHAERLKRE
ncbi:MAG: formate dehydrogenase accessory sulfurtransferase FdhD [Cytophagales bacterium]|nr:MAG: formate dehydrogenase accessory sulfurtransferase FdhD [Cytophagales bacterium]TAF59345.1 MAG: formate dehydrogenase accessory sulfurtransferase FdhD [Cytophagales bacterium]